MSDEEEKATWLQNYKPQGAGNPKWYPGMKSPNASGRPKGNYSKRDKITHILDGDGPAIVRTVIDAALAGDMQAAALVLARIYPPIKAQASHVNFNLSHDNTLSEQAGQILQAVAQGQVDPDTGKTLISCLNAVSSMQAIESLEQRLIILEQKAI